MKKLRIHLDKTDRLDDAIDQAFGVCRENPIDADAVRKDSNETGLPLATRNPKDFKHVQTECPYTI